MVQNIFKTLIVHENAFNKALCAIYNVVKMLSNTCINKVIQMIRHNKCFYFILLHISLTKPVCITPRCVYSVVIGERDMRRQINSLSLLKR